MTKEKSADSALGIIPSVLNAIGSVGESMPQSFKIPAPKGPITGAVQGFITRKEQVQGTVLHSLPSGIKEGLATRSAQGFALGTLSGMLQYDVKHHRSNMDEVRAEARNASDKGLITIRNPLSFYIPRDTRSAVSTLLTHLAEGNFFYNSMGQAEELYNQLQKH